MSDMTDEEYLTGEDTVFNVSEPDRPSRDRKEGWFFQSNDKISLLRALSLPGLFLKCPSGIPVFFL